MQEIRISGPDELRQYLPQFLDSGVLAVRLETTGPDPHSDRVRLLVIAAKELPTLVFDDIWFQPDRIKQLRELFSTLAVKVFHDAKHDLKFLMAWGIFPRPLFDASLAAQLLDFSGNSESSHLHELALKYLGDNLEPSPSDHLQAAIHDAHTLLRLRETMIPLLQRNKLVQVAEIEFQCVRAVAHIEYQGIYLDQKKWRKLLRQTETERDQVLKTLHSLIETPVVQKTFWGEETIHGQNFDSNVFVLKLLQDHDIPVSGTSKWDLVPFVGHPLVQSIVEYRKASKSLSSFLYPLLEWIHPATGRLHSQYGQLTTQSGRMSCWNPNIQAIPRDKSFRECFVSPPGRRLVIADYSQIELRVAAQISGDERMLSAFQSGEDLHLLTASYIANKPTHLVSKQERQAYKAVNLGFIYGMGARGLQTTAQMSYGIKMTLDDATLFRKRFFDTYQGIAAWHRRVMSTSVREGRTLTGRHVPFRKEAGLPERSNLPVQGTAADIIKKALWILVDRIDPDTKIVAVVHDEILIECPASRSEEAARTLKSAMEDAVNSILYDVPTNVAPVISTSWAEK